MKNTNIEFEKVYTLFFNLIYLYGVTTLIHVSSYIYITNIT